MTPPKMVKTGPCVSGQTLWVWKMAYDPKIICRIWRGVMVTAAAAFTLSMKVFLLLVDVEVAPLFAVDGANAASGMTWAGPGAFFVASLGMTPVMA
jgi:hypothetical protein